MSNLSLNAVMQRHFLPFVIHIIMKALNGFLMTQRQMTLKDTCAQVMLDSFIGHIPDAFLADTVDTTVDYCLVVQHLCCSVNCTIS